MGSGMRVGDVFACMCGGGRDKKVRNGKKKRRDENREKRGRKGRGQKTKSHKKDTKESCDRF